MTKVVPYDAKGAVLRFEAWNRQAVADTIK